MNEFRKKHYLIFKKKIETEINKIEKIIFDDPYSDYFKILEEAQKIIKSDLSNSEITKKIKSLSIKEKDCKRRMKRKQNNRDLELTKKLSNLKFELGEINNELWKIELHEKSRRAG